MTDLIIHNVEDAYRIKYIDIPTTDGDIVNGNMVISRRYNLTSKEDLFVKRIRNLEYIEVCFMGLFLFDNTRKWVDIEGEFSCCEFINCRVAEGAEINFIATAVADITFINSPEIEIAYIEWLRQEQQSERAAMRRLAPPKWR